MASHSPADAEKVARAFHEAYERLAPLFGWTTQQASRTEWENVPIDNRDLMTAVAFELLTRNVISVGSDISSGGSDTKPETEAQPDSARSSWCPH